MPMNHEYKASWLAALRSGKYKQTKSVLYDGSGYCCLGVLCKVAGSSFYDEDCSQPDPSYVPTNVLGYTPGHSATLTDHGLSLFGLDHATQDKLTDMNDGKPAGSKWLPEEDAYVQTSRIEPKSFAEIADWIEENL